MSLSFISEFVKNFVFFLFPLILELFKIEQNYVWQNEKEHLEHSQFVIILMYFHVNFRNGI